MTATIKGAFVNIGRGTETQTRTLVEELAKLDIDFLVAVEIDEGGTVNEHHLLAEHFPPHEWARPVFAKSREVLLVRRATAVLHHDLIRAGRSVRHWSPIRPVHVVTLRLEDGTVLHVVFAHPAAGAGVQARNRPMWARGPLQTSHDRTLAVMFDQVAKLRRRGQTVLMLTDANSPTLRIPHRVAPAQVVFTKRPDFGRLWQHGNPVAQIHASTAHNPIEPGLHPVHTFVIHLEEHHS